MRNVFIACTVVVFAGACMLDAQAGWFGGGKKSEEKSAVQTPEQAAAGAMSKEEKKQQEQLKAQQKSAEEALKQRLAQQQKIMAQLNNQEWQLELTPLAGKAAKKEFDLVTFKDNKVSILGFTKKGFQPTNYSLTVQEDGMVIWETMQTSEKSGTAFWRGEMPKDMLSIRGVVSHVVDPKTKTDYSFVSTSKRALSSEPK